MTLDITPPESLKGPLRVPHKVLLGPGPTNADPRVLHAMTQPMLGHLHAETIRAMDQVVDGLRYAMQTKNDATLCVSATGHGGMECAVSNIVEPGDAVVVGCTGVWGIRAAEAVRRNGGRPYLVHALEGEPVTLESITAAVKQHQAKAVFLVHGDTSTGVLQPLEGFGKMCHKFDALLLVDAVATVGGVQLLADQWELDVVYSASQKALGGPPGLAPITFSPRAIQRVKARKTKCTSFYWDILELGPYWGCLGNDRGVRPYHHTVPVSLVLALRESLAILAEEGLEKSWERHSSVAEDLVRRVAPLGFTPLVRIPAHRLPSVTTLKPPASKASQWATEAPQIIGYIMKKHSIEISGGLGATAGRIIRVGLMGSNARLSSVDLVVSVLSEALNERSKL